MASSDPDSVLATQLTSLLHLLQHATSQAQAPATTWQRENHSWDRTYLHGIVARAEAVKALLLARHAESSAIMERVARLAEPLAVLRAALRVNEAQQDTKAMLWGLAAKLTLDNWALPLGSFRKARRQRRIGRAVAELRATFSSLEFLVKWEEE